MFPKELKFLESHEWARLESGAEIVTVGISDYAVEQLGDIVYLELPAPGDHVKKGEPFGTIESVKAASDIYTPVTGEVIEANDGLSENLELFKSVPYEAAWLIKVKPADPQELQTLMDARSYEEYVKGL